ncbi:MAG TPA: hypothetical protein PK987_11975 [Ferruginibacter sp.]|nr:hypothetical protein [Ferruginibacter sp.]
MKKFKIGLTAAVMLFAFSAFALEPVKLNSAVKAAFEKKFTNASGVSWEKNNEFYFASFTFNNEDVDAAYNETGELIGVSRRVAMSDVPLNISLALAEQYSGYEVDKTAVELTVEGSTWYSFKVKNGTRLLKLKAYSNGEIYVDSKIKI